MASGAGKARVAENLQPVRVCLAAQTLGGRLAHALQPSVVQVELQRRQIVRAQVPAEEKSRSAADC